MLKYCLILILILPGCASWEKTDKVLFGSFIALSAVDTIQATQIDGKNTHEGNPIFARDDGRADIGKIVAVKAAEFLLLYFVADQFPSIRTKLLVGANVLQGGIVVWNFYQF